MTPAQRAEKIDLPDYKMDGQDKVVLREAIAAQIQEDREEAKKEVSAYANAAYDDGFRKGFSAAKEMAKGIADTYLPLDRRDIADRIGRMTPESPKGELEPPKERTE